ncbi:MAG: chromosomal replication initiator protein, partial [Granulosicoccus sp.]
MRAPLWDRCLSQLEAELSDQQLNTWIRPLQAQHINEQLRIMAPNRFVLDMVQSSFRARIQEIATALNTPDEVDVVLVIGSELLTPSVNPNARSVATQQTSSRSWSDVNSYRSSGVSAAPAHSQIAKSVPAHQSNLKPQFSFNTLVEGKSNQLGRAAALQIGRSPG